MIDIPIGKYPNFGACTADQMKNGKSKESADKICGAMEQNAKESEKPKKELESLFTKAVELSEEKDGNYLYGILSTTNLDRGNDRISKECIVAWANDKRPLPLLSVHKNHWQEQVGVIVEKRALGDNEALFIKSKLLKSTDTAKAFVSYIKELREMNMGVGLSVGVANPVHEHAYNDEGEITSSLIKSGELVEGSVVPIGMNQDAFGYLAKMYDINVKGGSNMPEEKMADAQVETKAQVPIETKSEPVKQEPVVEVKNYDDQIANLTKELSEMKTKNEMLTEKTIEELIQKSIASFEATKKSVAVETQKNAQESMINRSFIK